MEKSELINLLDSLTLQEKIGQLVQLSGDFFDERLNTTETGPSQKIGLHDEYDIYHTGSALNVLDPVAIKTLQQTYLEKSRHKIPLVFMTDIIYGFNTIFPIPIAQSCSWDFDLIKESAAISAEEAYYAGQQVTFSPMVDLVRDPRWGRVMEAPGEDPYIGSQFSKSVVEGLQGEHATSIEPKKLAACVKHYAAYGAAEGGRDYNGVDMSLSKFYGQYLPAFKAAVEANVKLVMTAFNTLNGVPCTGNSWLNREVLRNQLGFKGLLITDYAANEELVTHGYAAGPEEAALMALESTVDVDMKTAVYANHLQGLVEAKELPIELVDQAVLRMLELKNDLGLFENPYRGLTDETTPTAEACHLTKALELAEKSTVLLKNNGVLPLANKGKIAIIGPYGDNPNTLGMWAINGDTSKTVTLKAGMNQVFDQAEILCVEGAPLIEEMDRLGFSTNIKPGVSHSPVRSKEALLAEALEVAQSADTIVVALGEHILESGEAGSKTSLAFAESQEALVHALKELGKPLIGIVYSGRPNNLTGILAHVDALLYGWYPGTMGGLAMANLLSGKANPSGKLTMSFPRSEGQIPVYYNGYRTGRPVKSEDDNHRFTSRYIDESNRPLFPFGYGLSYSEFKYRSINSSRLTVNGDQSVIIQVLVENVSEIDGEEIIQLYIKDETASIVRPLKELKAAKRVFLEAHSSKTIDFVLGKKEFEFFDNQGEAIIEPGAFTVFVGRNVEETPLHLELSYV